MTETRAEQTHRLRAKGLPPPRRRVTGMLGLSMAAILHLPGVRDASQGSGACHGRGVPASPLRAVLISTENPREYNVEIDGQLLGPTRTPVETVRARYQKRTVEFFFEDDAVPFTVQRPA